MSKKKSLSIRLLAITIFGMGFGIFGMKNEECKKAMDKEASDIYIMKARIYCH